MVGTPEINKVIRKILSPTLRENGFHKVNTRHNWGWNDHCIWVLDIAAVGKSFSDVTGWSPMSIIVELGIYYDFIPPRDEIKISAKGELLPKIYQCDVRYDLSCNLDQSKYTKNFYNRAEKERNDIWWIQPDGSNIEEVINDIKQDFLHNGLKWLIRNSNVETAYAEIEKEEDSYNKFYNAMYFAKHLNDNERLDMYSKLLEQEQKKFD
ncbi:DUF4304 domain-containing protein [Virgibacillus sp. 6R]|uniref:DUF4304 domain-containing protein n=1 Tax=Metabacillus sp. 22489 TaxID=3453928 RepID=UPI0011A19010